MEINISVKSDAKVMEAALDIALFKASKQLERIVRLKVDEQFEVEFKSLPDVTVVISRSE